MPDEAQPTIPRTVLAFALAIVFTATGASKLIDHAEAAADFARWGVPHAGTMAVAVGIFELAGAALLMMGVATRRVALALAAEMGLALAIAGSADGGLQLVVPPAIGVLCLVLARAARPAPRAEPRRERLPAR
jgi:putative oxidoreductase